MFAEVMTVSVSSKHDVSKTDDNGNEMICNSDNDCDSRINEVNNTLIQRVPSLQNNGQKDLTFSTNNNNNNNGDSQKCKHKWKMCSFDEAPEYVKHNVYILSGYRGILNTQQCIESVFWWTNETINIWSHIFGFALFFAATIRDFMEVDVYTCFYDKIIVAFVLSCFQLCMMFSALYHTFSCRSSRDCDVFLTYDLFGIALSLLAVYISGIYFAFWCDPCLCYFYIATVVLIFAVAMLLHMPCFEVNDSIKMFVFVGWAAYGVIPTAHWVIHMGWFESPIVKLLLPKVGMMYLISGTAFIIYLTKIPERLWAGKFDFLGHSHQWWHMLVLGALYYWHCSGMVYLEYRYNHGCSAPLTMIQ